MNLYVQLGRGRDYAWSATSAGQDIIDTYAVDLCETSRREADDRLDALHVPRPVPADGGADAARTPGPRTPADQTPAGTQTLRPSARARHRASPARRSRASRSPSRELRSTYFHEVDSAARLLRLQRPRQDPLAADFQRAASKIGYTFNWFYADDKHIAYFNSGDNPVRAAARRPDAAGRGLQRYEWQRL